MHILYIGGGFVGACSAAVSADSGHETLVYDIDAEKVAKLSTDDRDVIQSALHEQGLAELLIRNRSRIRFTTDLGEVRKFCQSVEAVFMCVPTPEKETGECDLSYYEKAVETIGPLVAERDGAPASRLVVVNKSTLPIQMINHTDELFARQGVRNFGIVSNPEFLVEGKAIDGSIRPDRVVVGAKTPDDFKLMRQIYQRFCDSSSIKYIEVNPYEAACGKLLANFILFNRVVTTYDVVGRTCEYFSDVGYEQVRQILTADPRIGSWGLYDSLFCGGSCFIKDAGSLAHQLEQVGTHATLVRGVLEANVFQRDHFFGRAQAEAGFSWTDQTVAVLGTAFKQDTNDIRNSGSIGIIEQLLAAGVAHIRLYDPIAAAETQKYFSLQKNELYRRLTYVDSEAQAIAGTAAAVICTDWPQFKTIADVITATAPPPYLIMDGRRMLTSQFSDLMAKGYDIIAVGSPFMPGKK